MPPTKKNDYMVSIDNAWQSVALEERLELISRSQATGVLASVAAMSLMGSIAYGFDQIWLLAAGFSSCIFVFPLFSSYCWRREKPGLILAYLAVRAVARRYAYGYNIPDLDIVLIYRGLMKEIFINREDEELAKQREYVELDRAPSEYKNVWIVLMRGGVVILSEKLGGAKLEFLTPITHESTLEQPSANEELPYERALQLDGMHGAKGRTVIITTKYPGAQYVFEKRFLALVEEQKAAEETRERLRTKTNA